MEHRQRITRRKDMDLADFPNLLDKKTREDLLRKGDTGRDIVAMGAVFHALNRSAEERSKPADPRFMHPKSRQFPFDEVTANIVKELEKMKFEVPGIKVELGHYGPSDSYTYVSKIEGSEFKLWFCRGQGRVGSGWNDIAAVTELIIPGKELSVYEDNSGPELHLYVGKDWESDKTKFLHSSKVLSKLHNEPKTYLTYRGSWKTDSRLAYDGEIAPFLTHDNDIGREYDPEGNEPKYFKTNEIFLEFKTYFEKVLAGISKA